MRDTEACEPGPVDLSRAEECDPITLDEGDTPGEPALHAALPRRLPHGRGLLERHRPQDRLPEPRRWPQNKLGKPIEAPPYNLNDGFSPGQAIVVKVPGLDTPEALEATDPITLDNLSRNDEALKNEPVVVIDAETGERWPIWVEIDSNASTPEETALLVHPARNFDSGPPLRRRARETSRTASTPSRSRLPTRSATTATTSPRTIRASRRSVTGSKTSFDDLRDAT